MGHRKGQGGGRAVRVDDGLAGEGGIQPADPQVAHDGGQQRPLGTRRIAPVDGKALAQRAVGLAKLLAVALDGAPLIVGLAAQGGGALRQKLRGVGNALGGDRRVGIAELLFQCQRMVAHAQRELENGHHDKKDGKGGRDQRPKALVRPVGLLPPGRGALAAHQIPHQQPQRRKGDAQQQQLEQAEGQKAADKFDRGRQQP